jgi:hypothetical protein
MTGSLEVLGDEAAVGLDGRPAVRRMRLSGTALSRQTVYSYKIA